MKPEIKFILFGFFLCIIGAICLDCNVQWTGATILSLGAFSILFGPMIVSICEQ